MQDKSFEEFVTEAITRIPRQYAEKMKHVAILIDDEPSLQQRHALGLRDCDALFGLYEGIPLTRRGGATLQVPPDRITIFKHPMIDLYPNVKELKAQIFETLWHEVAHFFGLNHSQIHLAKKRKNK